ncbi:glycoside hydrolase family 172 protein [Acrocarpospora pleiomorpha]|nr:glycoside hydrolase family 172 protein [Acrocarpospora pleiomorpha]
MRKGLTMFDVPGAAFGGPPRIGRLRSRSISAENPEGAPGAGGRTASRLGPGRKGRAFIPLRSGETADLARIDGPGVIRHIWLTVTDRTEAGPFVLRDLVLRAYWDGQDTPSVEAPLGDFFCNGFATRSQVTSLPIVVAPTGGMNCYFPMPFRSSALITLTSEHPGDIEALFYQIDYTVGDEVHEDTGRFHAQWRRSRVTQPGVDHVILDGVQGPGAYVGTYLGIAALERYWWGEGEVKFYLDGDVEHPTICGTGTEDYAGGAWAFQDRLATDGDVRVLTYSAPFFGYPHYSTADTSGRSPYATGMTPTHGLYRWHLPDPVYFQDDLRATVQQIGHDGTALFERADDVSSVAYWYQIGPTAPFPPMPDGAGRRPR